MGTLFSRRAAPGILAGLMFGSALLTACSGGGPSDNNPGAPQPARSLGLMELSVNAIGTAQMSAKARLLSAQKPATSSASFSDRPNGLDIAQVSASTLDVGAYRYVSVVYKVRNAQNCTDTPGSCTAYASASHNLTFLAASTAGTINGTAVSQIALQDGSSSDTTKALATTLVPANGVVSSNPAGRAVVASGEASLQAFSESELSGVALDPGATGLFPFGFVVENANDSTTRSLPASPAAGDYEGQLTFAFRFPRQATDAANPFSVSMIFQVLDDTNTRVTQSLEEQNYLGDKAALARAAALGATDLVVLGSHANLLLGGLSGAFRSSNLALLDPICAPRTAGPAGAATAWLSKPGFAITGAPSLLLPPATFLPALEFDFCQDTNLPIFPSYDSRSTPPRVTGTMVVSGSQSGLFMSQGSPSGGNIPIRYVSATGTNFTNLVITPAQPPIFYPDELISYTLTTGLADAYGDTLIKPFVGSILVDGVTTDTPGTFTAGGSLPAGHNPAGILAADFDGGQLDLAVTNAADNTVSVILGNGDGTFGAHLTTATGHNPVALAAADFNGDGGLDLAVVNKADNTVSILLANGDDTFTAAPIVTVGASPTALVVGDFNGDGIADLAVANSGDNTVYVLPGNGDGSFGTRQTLAVGTSPESVVSGDFDGDGALDLAVTNAGDHTVSILLGNGDGSFAAPRTVGVGNNPQGITSADFNNDGIPDLAVANQADGTVSILLGKGDGGFTVVQTPAAGNSATSLAVGDFNGDNNLDLIANSGTAVSVLFGNGDGSFITPATTITTGSFGSVAVGDFTQDDILDLVISNTAGASVSVLFGDLY